MYIPAAFRIKDLPKLTAFVQKHSFGSLITYDGSAPFVTHLPMLFRPSEGSQGTIVSHLSRANPQWHHFVTGAEALAIFQGPHAYISPVWYATEPAVPTWNYTAVHAYGVPRIFDDHATVVALLRETVSTFEAAFERPWPGDLPEAYRDKMMHGIVAFEMPVTRLEGKFKLSQNRSAADLQGVIEALARSEDAEHRALAEMMRAETAEADLHEPA